MNAGIDTLVLGCTHYPLLSGLLKLELGPDVVLVSSAEETAKDVYGELVSRELLAPTGSKPVHEFVTTGDPGQFQRLAEVFLGPEVRDLGVEQVTRGGRVELTVLGAQGTWPGAGGENCGYLLTEDGYHLQMDAGTGTFARLQQVVGVDDVGAMLITHGHPDHFVDIIPTFYARHYGRLGRPGLPLWSPGGFTDLAASLVSEKGRNVMAEAFDFRTAGAGEVFELGPFRITPFEMQHIGVYSLGYRIEAGGVVLAYTGDTGPCDAAVALGLDADLFLCEATYQNASKLYPFHLSAAQAGEVATAVGSRSPGPHAPDARSRPADLDPGGGRDLHRADRHRGAGDGPGGGSMSSPRRPRARAAAAGGVRARTTRNGPPAPCCSRWARPECCAPPPSRPKRLVGSEGRARDG